MGLDFSADNAPTFYLRSPDTEGEWQEIPFHEAMGLIENAPYETTEVWEIKVEPVERVEIPYVRWSYGGFGRFRERLWDEIRQADWPDLAMMQGFMPQTSIGVYRLKHGHDPSSEQMEPFDLFEGEMYEWWNLNATSWDKIEHPLKDLIHHSDCDGDLTPEQAKVIAPALREVVQKWGESDHDRQMGEALADALDICAQHGRRLIFC